MKCIICKSEIENDDNFCHNCGRWTPRGYVYFNENPENLKILEGNATNREKKLIILFSQISILIILFTIISIIRGNQIFKPFIEIKKQISNYQYGYHTSVIRTNNQYNKIKINNLEDAYQIIEKDINNQVWQCKKNIELFRLEEELKRKYQIKSISFCDMDLNEAKKLKNVLEKIWTLFPSTIGYLDTISITNATTKDEYIAYFQPIYQFVNGNEKITNYNKVNKTQILLNSYYFLNNKILSKDFNKVLQKDFYVKDANWESVIAHEMGHYITFVSLLKEKNIKNITLVTKENEDTINNLKEIIDNHTYANNILKEAYNSYNINYSQKDTIENLNNSISRYAATSKDEAIAEAIHDYYLHENNANPYSLEIIKVLKKKLGELA